MQEHLILKMKCVFKKNSVPVSCFQNIDLSVWASSVATLVQPIERVRGGIIHLWTNDTPDECFEHV